MAENRANETLKKSGRGNNEKKVQCKLKEHLHIHSSNGEKIIQGKKNFKGYQPYILTVERRYTQNSAYGVKLFAE